MAWASTAFLSVLFPLQLLGAQVGRPEVQLAGTTSPQRRLLLQVAGKLRRGQLDSHAAAVATSKSSDPHEAAWFQSLDGSRPEDKLQYDVPIGSRGRTPAGKAVEQQQAPKSSAQSVSRRIEKAHEVATKVEWLQQVVTKAEQPDLSLRSVSGNLTCPDPGCAANVTLQVYEPLKEFVQECKLSVAVHATDFDDNYAGEGVFDMLANGRALMSSCFPLTNGCVSQLSREQLYPCAQDVPVDTIISSSGKLRVMAQISKEVDECAYNGNLLHGVSTVTCRVGQITTTTTTTTTTPPPPDAVYPLKNDFVHKWLEENPDSATQDIFKRWLDQNPGKSIEDMPGYDSWVESIQDNPTRKEPLSILRPSWENTTSDHTYISRLQNLSTSGPMRCAERGCSVRMMLDINKTLLTINKCTAQMWVNQTDFDNLDGAYERLSVNVSGEQVLVEAKPGKNPCRSFYYDGKALSGEERRFQALKDYDITEAVKKGPVEFAARISSQVDECASNGYLLDSVLEVTCNISTIGALLQRGEVSVPEVLELNEVLLEASSNSEIDAAVNEFKDSLEAEADSTANANSTDTSTSNKSAKASLLDGVSAKVSAKSKSAGMRK